MPQFVLRVALDDRAGLAAVEHDLGLLAEERGDYPVALAARTGARKRRRSASTRLLSRAQPRGAASPAGPRRVNIEIPR